MSHRFPYPRRVGTCCVEASEPPAHLDLGAADEWRILVTLRGVPCSYLRLPSPGGGPSPALVDAAVVRQADELAAWTHFAEAFRRRLGVPERKPTRLSCSVVMCTHRRPEYIADVLAGLERLDPPADEIVVVDNDPGDRDCRAHVEAAGARYVREDRRGLDNARNAGLRAARRELVAFTDDDCVPAPGWLRSLPASFDDPMVAVVTGPAFAYSLDTPAQARFEDQGGHRRGLHPRTLDWRVLTPIASTRAGAGLNMIFRRSAIDPLGELFPPELDAGTPTESGGDTYALYKVLRAGYRIVYDPATYVFHQHRPDSRSLHRAIRGYGIGLTAVLTKLLLEERELAGPSVWYWLWWLYADAVRRGLAGRNDPVEVRIGWDYLLGGLLGAGAWWRSRRRFARGARRSAHPRPAVPGPDAAPQLAFDARTTPDPGGDPAVSVVVAAPTPGSEAPCLRALARQELDDGLEVIVVGASSNGAHTAASEEELAVRRVPAEAAHGARNTGARAARGDLVLFLDAGAVPTTDLVARHLESHRSSDRERLVVGYSPPRPVRETLPALYESLRWHDHFEMKRGAAATTFADVLADNTSVGRETFERLGGFDAAFEGSGREGWELGVRALEAGVEVVHERRALAPRGLSTTTAGAIERASHEGRGDALLEVRHPVVSPSLPEPASRSALLARPLFALGFALLRSRRARTGAAVALDLLERLRARRLWLRLFELARYAAYEQGASEGGRGRPNASRSHVLRVELASEEPIPPPAVAPPLIELTHEGRPVGRVTPAGGQWHRHLADQAATAVGGRLLELPHERLPAFEETDTGRDLSEAAVILGPARRPGDDRHRRALEAAGATVELLDGDPGEHWVELDRAVRRSERQLVALPLPGVAAGPAWLAGARLALEGHRVAAAVGAGLEDAKPPQRLFLGSRRLLPLPYTPLGRPAQYLLVRREAYEAVGGFDFGAAPLGPQGPVLELLERALDSGYVIAYRDTHGLAPLETSGRARRRAGWERQQARGGLMLRRARRAGGVHGSSWFVRRGVLPLAGDLWRSFRTGEPRPTSAAGGAAAFLTGAAIAAGTATPRPPQETSAG